MLFTNRIKGVASFLHNNNLVVQKTAYKHMLHLVFGRSTKQKMLKLKSQHSRCTWNKDETKHLLELMKENKVMDLLDGKTRRNKNVYTLLSQELANKGFNKSSDQVKLKFRTLKQQFLKTKRNNGKSGAQRHTMEHYNDLEELLGDRPVTAAVGLDTTMDNELWDVMFLEEENDAASISELGSEVIEEESYDVSNESMVSGTQKNTERAPKKKRSAVQLTLLEIAADVKESQEKSLLMLQKENASFLAEQRRLHDEYLKATKDMMAEDRRETKEMFLELFSKKS